MSLSLTSQDLELVEPVTRRLRDSVHEMPAKEAARLLGTSVQTVTRLRAGELPGSVLLLRAIKTFGVGLIESVTGPMNAEYQLSRLDRVEQILSEIRNGVSSSPAAGRASPEGVVSEDRRDSGGLVHELGGTLDLGSGQHVLPLAAASEESVALVQRRRPASYLDSREGEPLRRHLNFFDKVVSLDHARAVMQADNRRKTGLAYKRPREDWTLLPAPENRLWTPCNDPRRAEDYTGDVAALRRDLDEAARSDRPIVVTHAGAFVRDGNLLNFNSTVVRIGGKAKCGADLVVTDFVRRTA